MAWPPNQQQVAPPPVVQQAPIGQAYGYDPSQVPLAPQQTAQPYYPGQPTPVFQQPQPQQPQQPVWPQQGYPQQMLGQPPQQQVMQPQQQRMQFDESVVLDGPGVAPELRGRTMGDAMRLYRALSSDWLSRQRQPATPAQQTLAAQGIQQPVQAQPWGGVPSTPVQQVPQQQAPQQAQFQQQLQQAVQQAVAPMLQPVMQQTQNQAILSARQQAMTGIQDFAYLEADIIQSLSGASPELLANPQIWQMAADAARGAKVRAGQYRPQAMQPRLPGSGNGATGPGAAVPAQQLPPAYQFFTESPSAPTLGAGVYGANARQVTQEDQFYARQFNMPIENYMAWKYGATQPVGVL